MSFVVTVKADTRAAQAGIGGLKKSLDDVEQRTVRGRDQFGRFTSSAARGMNTVRDATGRARDEFGRFVGTGSSSMSKMAASAGTLRGQIQGLVVAAGAYVGITKSIETLDTYTSISSRLNIVAKDQQNLNGLMQESLDVANATRSEWNTTAEAFTRFSGAFKSLGSSQQEVMDFTSGINKVMKLAGATTGEANSAVLQLSQGLAAGALRGDEFNSVAENSPPLMDLIAKTMGKTRGELRALAADGKITAQIMRDAILKNLPEIDKAFAKTTPTIAQGFTVMKNEAIKFFGEAGKGSGITRTLGAAMTWLAENFTIVAKTALAVGQALIGLYVIDKIIVMIRALTVAMAANPLGALLVALAVGIALLRQFGDSLKAGSGHLATVGDVLRVLWQDIKTLAGAVVDFVENAWSKLTGAFSDGLDGTGIELSLKSVLMFIASFVDAAIGMFKFLGNSIVTVFGGIPAFLGEVFIKLAQDIAKVFQDLINKIVGAYNTVRGAVFDAMNDTGGKRLAALKEADASWQKQQPAALQRASDRVKLGYNDPGYQAQLEASYRRVEEERLHNLALAYDRRGLDAQGNDPRSGKIGQIDLSFNNPLEGAGKAAWQKVRSDFDAALNESSAKDYTNSLLSRGDLAAANRNDAAGGYVSGAAGKKDKTGPSKEAIAAMKKLQKELDALLKQSNPLVEAEMKFAHAVDVTGRALDAKMISMEGANTLLADLATQLHDARFPYEAWVTEIRAEADALGMSAGERERANEIRRVENDLRQKGLEIGDDIRSDIEREVDAMRGRQAAADAMLEHQKELQSALDRIRAPADEYNRGLSVAQELMRDNAITAVEYQAELDRLSDVYRDATDTGRSFQDGLSRGWRSIVDDMTNVAAATETALTNAFGNIEDAIVRLAQTGKFSFKDMVNSMLGDMTRLLTRQIFSSILGAISPSTPLTAAYDAVHGTVGNRHATGGSWIVRGPGGTDSVPVSFMASPGERVTVATGSEQARDERNGPGASPTIVIQNHTDPNELLRVMQTPAGARIIRNMIRR